MSNRNFNPKSTRSSNEHELSKSTTSESGPAGSGSGAGSASKVSGSRSVPATEATDSNFMSKFKEKQHDEDLDQEEGTDDDEDGDNKVVTEKDQLRETSTHIVVEHHRTGTVKTHVYSSKDGKPSLLRHHHPDRNQVDVNADQLLNRNLENMNGFLHSSLEDHKIESLTAFREILQETEERQIHCHDRIVSAVIESFDTTIRQDVVPKLETITQMLTNAAIASASATAVAAAATPTSASIKTIGGREYPASEKSVKSNKTVGSSMDPMDRQYSDTPCTCSDPTCTYSHEMVTEENVRAKAYSSTGSAMDPAVLEKLTKIEDRVETMYKVVVEGEIPPLPELGPDGENNEVAAAATVDSTMYAQMEEMRRELLTFPDTLLEAHDRMGELIQCLAENQQATLTKDAQDTERAAQRAAEDSKRFEFLQEEDRTWKEYTKNVHESQHALFEELGSKFDASSKSSKYALKTFLHFMLMTHKHAKGMDQKVDMALQDMLNRPHVDPVVHAEFSVALSHMRDDLQRILYELPATIAETLNRSREPEVVEAPASEQQQQQHEPSIRDGTIVGSTAAVVGAEIRREVNVKENVATGQQAATDAAAITVPDLEAVTGNNAGTEHLVTMVESLQASIATMMQRLSEIPVWTHPPPVVERITTCTTAADVEVVEPAPEIPPVPPPRETPLERQARQKAERAAAAAAAAEEAARELSSREAPTNGAPGIRGNTAAVNGQDGSGKEEVVVTDKATAESDNTLSSPLLSSFLKELEVMSKTLGGLMEAVSATTAKLSDGQSMLHLTMISEIQRVLHTLSPPVTEEEQEKMIEEDIRRQQIALEEENKKRIEERKKAEEQAIIDANKRKEAEEAIQKATEERAMALEQIGMLPGIVSSVDAVGYLVGGKIDAIGSQVAINFNETQQHLYAIQQEVNTFSSATANESAMLSTINQQLTVIMSESGTNSDQFLKEQVAEAIRTATDVFEAVEDVKKISRRTLEQQELLEQRLEAWHRRHDEGFETLNIKHDEASSWNASFTERITGIETSQGRHTEQLTGLESWNGRHDQDMRGIEGRYQLQGQEHAEWQHKHDEAMASWHQAHCETLNRMELKHGEGIERLEQRHCYGCVVANANCNVRIGESVTFQPPLSDPNAAQENGATPSGPGPRSHGELDGNGGGDGVFNGMSRAPSQSWGQGQQQEIIDADTTAPCEDCNDESSINSQLQSFLQEYIPGYNGGCLRCGNKSSKAKSTHTRATQWTSGTVAQEPFTSYVTPGGGSVRQLDTNIAAQSSTASGHFPSPAENIAGIYRSREAALIAAATDPNSKKGDTATGSGPPGEEGATALSGTNGNTAASVAGMSIPTTGVTTDAPTVRGVTLPLALYGLLRPFFHPEGGAETSVDSEALSKLQFDYFQLIKAHEELKEEYTKTMNESSDIITGSMQKNQIIATLEDAKIQLTTDLTLQTQRLEESQLELTRSNDLIIQLYREGLGLKCAKDQEEKPPTKVASSNGEDSDVESVGSFHTPRYGLMHEAADQLRQTLDEFREQTSILRLEIEELNDQKQTYLQERAAREQKEQLDAIAAATAAVAAAEAEEEAKKAAAASKSNENDYTDTDEAEDDNDEVIHIQRRSKQPQKEQQRRSRSRSGAKVQSGSVSGSSVSSSRYHQRNRSTVPENHPRFEKVPLLEADIKVTRDGGDSETLFTSKNLLSSVQFERLANVASAQDDGDESLWTLNCDFKLRMAPPRRRR
ncbi:hypothetical protein BGZ83_008455 [Gryganskiella cystojenkinii]|nr:hypothetical protein BGZ83_008455 [Gryganskiella cystojenkinii]